MFCIAPDDPAVSHTKRGLPQCCVQFFIPGGHSFGMPSSTYNASFSPLWSSLVVPLVLFFLFSPLLLQPLSNLGVAVQASSACSLSFRCSTPVYTTICPSFVNHTFLCNPKYDTQNWTISHNVSFVFDVCVWSFIHMGFAPLACHRSSGVSIRVRSLLATEFSLLFTPLAVILVVVLLDPTWPGTVGLSPDTPTSPPQVACIGSSSIRTASATCSTVYGEILFAAPLPKPRKAYPSLPRCVSLSPSSPSLLPLLCSSSGAISLCRKCHTRVLGQERHIKGAGETVSARQNRMLRRCRLQCLCTRLWKHTASCNERKRRKRTAGGEKGWFVFVQKTIVLVEEGERVE